MKNLIVKLLVWALRPVVLKIVSEMPKPKTIGDLVKEKAGKEGLTMREFWEKHPYPPQWQRVLLYKNISAAVRCCHGKFTWRQVIYLANNESRFLAAILARKNSVFNPKG